MPTEVLTVRALNRATLDRQMLLRRRDTSALEALEHLAGMQSQAPDAPYVGLWNRVAGFEAAQLCDLMTERAAVRTHLMRNTVHLVSARDALAWSSTFAPMVAATFANTFKRELVGLDVDAVVAAGTELLTDRQLTRAELGTRLATRWPDRDAASLAYAVTHHVPLVQVPPRGLWRHGGRAAFTTLSAWLGAKPDPNSSVDEVVLRYLTAFGPASVADVQAWSRLTKLREVVDRLDLRTFTSETGALLFDLPDAPRPDADTVAAPRFLPEYDNLLLSHADRSRVIPDGRRVPLPPGNGGTAGSLLVDGFWRADWRIKHSKDRSTVTLTVEPFARLSTHDVQAITDEGLRLLEFAQPSRAHDVRVIAV